MDPDARAVPKRYFVRDLLLLGVALPLLAQLCLVAAAAGVSAVRAGGAGAAIAGCAVLFAGGLLGHWQGRHDDLPEAWGWRYGPVLALLVLLLVLWAVDMHLSGGDFSRRGLHPLGYLPYVPWIGLMFAAAFGGKWLLLAVPALAYAGYAAAVWRAGRYRPATGAGARRPVVVLLALLALVIGWQFHQRLQAMPPLGLAGERIQEEVELHQYRPFQAGNKLVAVPQQPVRFERADAPRLDGATAAYPLYAAMAQSFYTPEAARQAVTWSRTAGAYERLVRGEADAIFVAQASPAQERKAREAGVTLQFTPIAREAFVFVVNAANPVQALTAAQVRDIYAGRITQWSEVGGSGGAIVAFQRPPDSGSQTVMQARVMQGMAMRRPMEEEVAQSMGGLVRQVASYRNAPQSLGYSFRYYTTRMRDPQGLRLLAIDGVAPTADNVRSGAYPYTVDVFMVTTDRSRPGVARLREWLLGAQGQQLVEDVGYVRR